MKFRFSDSEEYCPSMFEAQLEKGEKMENALALLPVPHLFYSASNQLFPFGLSLLWENDCFSFLRRCQADSPSSLLSFLLIFPSGQLFVLPYLKFMALIAHKKTLCTASSLLISEVFNNNSTEMQESCAFHMDGMCAFIAHHQRENATQAFVCSMQ